MAADESERLAYSGRKIVQLRGARRLALIADIAAGEMTLATLAKKYNTGSNTISRFKRDHKAAIEAKMRNLEDDLYGLTLTTKAARLAEYEQDVFDINDAEQDRREAIKKALGDALDVEAALGQSEELRPDPQQLRAKHRALRSIAEELGQLPSRIAIELGETKVRHVLEGVDLDQL